MKVPDLGSVLISLLSMKALIRFFSENHVIESSRFRVRTYLTAQFSSMRGLNLIPIVTHNVTPNIDTRRVTQNVTPSVTVNVAPSVIPICDHGLF